MKKIVLFIILFILWSSSVFWYSQNDINKIMNSYYNSIDDKSYFYKKNRINHLLDRVSIIESKISDSSSNYKTLLLIKNSLNNFKFELNDFNISNYYNYEYSNIIFTFDNSLDFNLDIIQKNKQNIKNSFSVFLFRKKTNIDYDILKKSISEIKKINPNIIIYIDQEWWLINRYKDFSSVDYDYYLQNDYIYNKYQDLSVKERKVLENIFSNKYFPSMKDIYSWYDSVSENNKKNYLDIIAFIRLQNLVDIWINTHWLVLDLDNWNPVISWLERSFSNKIDDYKMLIDSYIWASSVTGVILYAKHFPWHWEGEVDSHNNILVYDDNYDYLIKNIELFEYFLENNTTKSWLMVWHMYLPLKIRDNFLHVLSLSDFILTDDLSMNWYKNADYYENNNMFFSTYEALDTDNIFIKVNTSNNIISNKIE